MSSNPSKHSRPPVVVIMGHVDHGKTTLLDYIRKSNVAAKEAGGITQGVGAYEITHKDQRITFIDTPGHAAFTKMRSRGANIADIAVLVVAADDGVNVQTKEAIAIIQATDIPYVVAINKIDKNNADVERTKTDLIKAGVLIEGYGGNISFQPLSAKTGEGVDELLDLITLTADVEELTYDPSLPGSGLILEAKNDSKSGILVTAIVKNGTLKAGDAIQSGTSAGKIKGLKNFLGENVKTLIPCSPAVILGFETLPAIGDEFVTGSQAKRVVAGPAAVKQRSALGVNEPGKINLILKSNLAGSLEALSEAVKKIQAPGGKVINVLSEGVGDVTDGDTKLAVSTGAMIVAFKVKVTTAAQTVVRTFGIKLFESEIIYELLQSLEDDMLGRKKLIVTGTLEVLAVFGAKGPKTPDKPAKKEKEKENKNQIIGGKVLEGEIKNQSVIEIERRGAIIGTGKIVNLQQNRKDASEVIAGLECGMLVASEVPILKGDKIIAKAA